VGGDDVNVARLALLVRVHDDIGDRLGRRQADSVQTLAFDTGLAGERRQGPTRGGDGPRHGFV
jgi:hypothetical protein